MLENTHLRLPPAVRFLWVTLVSCWSGRYAAWHLQTTPGSWRRLAHCSSPTPLPVICSATASQAQACIWVLQYLQISKYYAGLKLVCAQATVYATMKKMTRIMYMYIPVAKWQKINGFFPKMSSGSTSSNDFLNTSRWTFVKTSMSGVSTILSP